MEKTPYEYIEGFGVIPKKYEFLKVYVDDFTPVNVRKSLKLVHTQHETKIS